MLIGLIRQLGARVRRERNAAGCTRLGLSVARDCQRSCVTVPGVAWVLGYTIAAEIGDITRFPNPTKLCGYTGLCPKVRQSGGMDRRGPLAKN
jgi:transposase